MKRKTTKKKQETKVSLYGLSTDEALKALLSIPAPKKKRKKTN
jgi:hypothetical protein